MIGPAVSGTGEWVGGHWQSYAAWHQSWVTGWGLVGTAYAAATPPDVEGLAAQVRDVVRGLVHSIEELQSRCGALESQLGALRTQLAKKGRKK